MSAPLEHTPAEHQLIEELAGDLSAIGHSPQRGHFVEGRKGYPRVYGETREQALRNFREKIATLLTGKL